MAINSLYRDYFQKSRMFIYPILNIKRGAAPAVPSQTYVSWEGLYAPGDTKFVCSYKKRDDEDFLVFENNKLLSNPLFHEYFETEEGSGVYVFDFSDYTHDWNCFISGKYSKMNPEYKSKVKSFFSNVNSHYAYVESYLWPEKYMRMYADILTTDNRDIPVMMKILNEVGELCSPPDIEKETFIERVRNPLLNPKIV